MKKVFLNSTLMLGALSLVLIFTASVTPSNKISTDPFKASEVAGYRNWTRVNKNPVKLDAQTAVMCAPASAARANDNPHTNKFISVYVNDTGKAAMLKEVSPQFPQGAIIVKEKLVNATATAPELLTAMVKRESGYNPTSNDWEFMVLSGDAKTIIERGKLVSCMTCHTAKRQQDFVFRNYVDPADWGKMK